MSIKGQVWYVSRQNYWPDGDLVVEVAFGGGDYSNPDQLSVKYGKLGEGQEYSDPREAIKVAIVIRNTWNEDNNIESEVRVGYTGGNTIPFEGGESDEELLNWAEKRYLTLSKCDHCGRLIEKEPWERFDDSDNLKFCSEYCAENYV